MLLDASEGFAYGDAPVTPQQDIRGSMPVRLTHANVKGLVPRATRYTVFDSDVKGFGVRVTPNGAKSFIFEYRTGGRETTKQRVTLGSFPGLKVEDARKAAEQTRAQKALGADPAADKRQAKLDATVKEAADAWLAEHVKAKRKSRTALDYELTLNKHVVPALGKTRLRELKRTDVTRLHSRVSKAAPIAANRVLAVVSSLWTWAARREMCAFEANPAKGIERNKEQRRERFLDDVELERLGATLALAESHGLPYSVDETKAGAKHAAKPENRRTKIDPRVCDVIRLLLLTGCRLREVLHLKWSEIDFQRGLLLLGDSKTGAKPVILSAMALDLLREQEREAECDFVFPGAGGEARSDLKKPWSSIVKHAELEGLRIHDLRHTAASLAAGAGFSLPVIGRLLGHSQPATTARYAHLAHDPVRDAADAIGSIVGAAIGRRKRG